MDETERLGAWFYAQDKVVAGYLLKPNIKSEMKQAHPLEPRPQTAQEDKGIR